MGNSLDPLHTSLASMQALPYLISYVHQTKLQLVNFHRLVISEFNAIAYILVCATRVEGECLETNYFKLVLCMACSLLHSTTTE